MSRVIMFSRVFPTYHPKAGQPIYFVEQICNAIGVSKVNGIELDKGVIGEKYHTIRKGNRWKVGDKFSPRVWSGMPYRSKQIIIADDIEVKQVYDFEIKNNAIYINGKTSSLQNIDLALNDGLEYRDMLSWFKFPNPFKGQIICWSDEVNYYK